MVLIPRSVFQQKTSFRCVWLIFTRSKVQRIHGWQEDDVEQERPRQPITPQISLIPTPAL